MIQNEKVNIYYGSKVAYDFEKQNKRIDENALYFIEGVLYSGYELYSQDYKKVSSYPSIGQKNCIYINTTDSSVAIWDYDKNEWIYLCMPVSNEIINNSNSIATSSAVYKVLQNTKEYTDKKCNEMSESLTDTLNTAIENSIVDYNKNLFAESDKYNSVSDIENAIDDITNRESVLQFSIEEEKNRAITAESEVKNTIETNKPIWDDKYTKVEIDNKFSAFETNIDWKEAVDAYSKIATTYPNPEDGWTVNVKDTNYTYRYNGDEWVPISANAIPKATNDVDGLLSKEDHAKYEEAYSQKHSHSNKSILDTITSTLIDAWNSAVTHISDTVKHITSDERTLWNTVSNKADSNHTHNYAGSSSAGGAANSSIKLDSSAGSATQPVYFSDGKPVATTYTLGKSVPSNAVFTDTTYSSLKNPYALTLKANGTSLGTYDGSAAKTFDITASGVGAAASSHTHSDYATKASPTFTGSISLNRKSGSTIGTNSIVTGGSDYAGNANVASGKNSAVIGGYANDAINNNDVVIGGSNNNAKSEGKVGSTIIGGSGNIANGNYSVIIGGGYNTTNAANSAIIAGSDCITNGTNGLATGYNVTALQCQLATGHYNDTTLAKDNSESGTSDGTAFVIGNGTSTAKSNAFRVTGKGVAYAKGAYNSTGADYAEFAEWADGNPNNEDRRGYFVTFDEEKTTMIRKANAGDYVLGIVSGNPCIIGNADEGWLGKYIYDEYGSIVYEDVEIEESYTDETGEEKTRTVKVNTYKINPEYDPTKEYIHREKRQEWAAVGWIGVLSVRDDGTCKVGGYCKVADGGIATASERGIDSYRVIERVTDNIVKVVLK